MYTCTCIYATRSLKREKTPDIFAVLIRIETLQCTTATVETVFTGSWRTIYAKWNSKFFRGGPLFQPLSKILVLRYMYIYDGVSLASQPYFSGRVEDKNTSGPTHQVFVISWTEPIKLQHWRLIAIIGLQVYQTCEKMAAYSERKIDKAMSKAAKALGYSELRPKQRQVVKAFVKGQDVFVSQSLCYCVFNTLRHITGSSVAVVVSPLTQRHTLCTLLPLDVVWTPVKSRVHAWCHISTYHSETKTWRVGPDVLFSSTHPEKYGRLARLRWGLV